MSENLVRTAIAEGIKAAIDEITQAQDQARDLIAGFELLSTLSQEAASTQQASVVFQFNKAVRDGSSDVVLTTNIQNGGSGTFAYSYNSNKTGYLEVTVYANGTMAVDGNDVKNAVVIDDKIVHLTNEEKTASVLKEVAQKAVLYKMLPSPTL